MLTISRYLNPKNITIFSRSCLLRKVFCLSDFHAQMSIPITLFFTELEAISTQPYMILFAPQSNGKVVLKIEASVQMKLCLQRLQPLLSVYDNFISIPIGDHPERTKLTFFTNLHTVNVTGETLVLNKNFANIKPGFCQP